MCGVNDLQLCKSHGNKPNKTSNQQRTNPCKTISPENPNKSVTMGRNEKRPFASMPLFHPKSLSSDSHLCLVGIGAWNVNRWCRARGESPLGRGPRYHTAGRSGWLPRCGDIQPGCTAASVRARSAIPIPPRRMLVTSYSCRHKAQISATTAGHKSDNEPREVLAAVGVFKDALQPPLRASLCKAALHPSCNLNASSGCGYKRTLRNDSPCKVYLPCL